MSITEGHGDVFVSHQFFHCRQFYTCHHEPRSKGVTQIVECEIRDTCSLYRCSKSP